MNEYDLPVNTETGEIVYEYEILPVHHKKTVTERNRERCQKCPPILCKTVEQIEDYVKYCVDLRKCRLLDKSEDYHNVCCGYSVRNKARTYLTLPQLKLIKKLIPYIQYENIIILNMDGIVKALGCPRHKVQERLSVISDHVIRDTDGVKRGVYKLLINPQIAFKFDRHYLDAKRTQAVGDWYMRKMYV